MQNTDIILINPSRQFIVLTTLVLMISIGIILNTPVSLLSIWNKILLVIITMTYGLWIIWSDGLMRSAYSVLKLQLLPDGLCRLYYQGRFVEGKIKGDSTVTTRICLLRFFISSEQKNKKIKSCVLFRDAMDTISYRQLLIWLRCTNSIKLN